MHATNNFLMARFNQRGGDNANAQFFFSSTYPDVTRVPPGASTFNGVLGLNSWEQKNGTQ